MKLSRGEKAFRAANYLLLSALAFSMLYPFWHVLVLSLNDGMDTASGGIFWWPRVFTLANFRAVFADSAILNAYKITVLRTSIGTTGSILFTAAVAFGLSRKELPGRNFIIGLIFVTMLFGGGLIPYYLLLRGLHLLNTFWVFVIPGLFSVWNMIVMKTWFNQIPASLIESAMLDGADYLTIFIRIVLPTSLPMLAALSLFTAVGHWNDWFSGAFFVTDLKLVPVQTYLQRVLTTLLASSQISDVNAMSASEAQKIMFRGVTTLKSVRMATIMAVTLPILVVYPFLQRFFIKGILIGSVKE